MLRPAIIFKDELEKLFAKEIYSERYFYYMGYAYGFELPQIKAQDRYYQWAIVQDETPIGYLAYSIEPLTDCAYNFGLYSFDEGNPLVIKDVFNKLEELVDRHHRVEWRVIEGNHAKRGYDSFCAKHNGNSTCLHDVTKDLQGNYRNEYIYEIIKEQSK